MAGRPASDSPHLTLETVLCADDRSGYQITCVYGEICADEIYFGEKVNVDVPPTVYVYFKCITNMRKTTGFWVLR